MAPSWIELLVGCRDGESEAVQSWLEGFPRLPLEGVPHPYAL